jgi:hypothetical protein
LVALRLDFLPNDYHQVRPTLGVIERHITKVDYIPIKTLVGIAVDLRAPDVRFDSVRVSLVMRHEGVALLRRQGEPLAEHVASDETQLIIAAKSNGILPFSPRDET